MARGGTDVGNGVEPLRANSNLMRGIVPMGVWTAGQTVFEGTTVADLGIQEGGGECVLWCRCSVAVVTALCMQEH